MEFNQLVTLLYKGALETLYMVILSTACSYLAGIPLGVLLFITDKNGICRCRIVNTVLGDCEFDPVHTFYYSADCHSAFYKACGRNDDWNKCNGSSADCSSHSVYCTNGGIIFKGGGSGRN